MSINTVTNTNLRERVFLNDFTLFLIGTAMSDDGVISTSPLAFSDVLLSHIYISKLYFGHGGSRSGNCTNYGEVFKNNTNNRCPSVQQI